MYKIRESKGFAYESRGKFYARVTIAPQKRNEMALSWCTSLGAARARAHVLQALVNRLREAGEDSWIAKVLEIGAPADEAKLAELSGYVDEIVKGKIVKVPTGPAIVTFEAFALRWVRGELAALYPDHVERKRSAYTDLCMLRKYVFPVVGARPIADVSIADYERVMRETAERALPKKLKRTSRRAIAQAMRRVMQLAEYPAKLIERNPIPENAMPKKRQELALNWLYPSEDAQLLGCTTVDLGLRVAIGFGTRAGWRREEALGGEVETVPGAITDHEQALEDVPPLAWSRLDLAHGIVHMDREKTGNPRPVPIDPDIVRALEAWRELTPKPGANHPVFVDMAGRQINPDEAKDLLHQALRKAKVERAELYTKSSKREPLRWHDLRASMVTVALANGRPEEWVRRRTGHKSSAMERYRRVAATLGEMNVGDWSPLDLAIPELADTNVSVNVSAAVDKPTRTKAKRPTIPISRGDWIRTSDPLTPSQVR